MSDSEWFVYLNEVKKGPFSTQEVLNRIQQTSSNGKILPHTRIWKKGMEAWMPASSVNEFKSYFSNSKKSKNNTSELSALLEVNPNEIDDRTGVIDAAQLKKAKKEAIKVERQIRKSKRTSSNILKVIFAFSILAGIGYYLFQSGKLDQFLSPLPQLDGISNEQFEQLKLIVKSDFKTEGAKLEVAVPPKPLDQAMFYAVTNLPDGISFQAYLQSTPGKILDTKNINIQFPMTFAKKLALSPRLRTEEGMNLPSGEYNLYLTEADEQTPSIQLTLSNLPQLKDKPSFIPSGNKILYSKQIFLGENNPDFQTKLNEIQKKIAEDAQRTQPTATPYPTPSSTPSSL